MKSDRFGKSLEEGLLCQEAASYDPQCAAEVEKAKTLEEIDEALS
jgi:hypothetical protein